MNVSIVISLVALMTSVLSPAINCYISLKRDRENNKMKLANEKKEKMNKAFDDFIFYLHKQSHIHLSAEEERKLLSSCSSLISALNNQKQIECLKQFRKAYIIDRNINLLHNDDFYTLIDDINEELNS